MDEETLDSILLVASQQYEEEVEEQVLLMASQQYENEVSASSQSELTAPIDTPSKPASSRFGPSVDLDEMIKDAIPTKTRQQTKWCTDTWDAWHSHHTTVATTPQEIPPKLLDMDNE